MVKSTNIFEILQSNLRPFKNHALAQSYQPLLNERILECIPFRQFRTYLLLVLSEITWYGGNDIILDEVDITIDVSRP